MIFKKQKWVSWETYQQKANNNMGLSFVMKCRNTFLPRGN